MKKYILIVCALALLSSCTLGLTCGKSNVVEQRVTNSVDSTTTTFSLYPVK